VGTRSEAAHATLLGLVQLRDKMIYEFFAGIARKMDNVVAFFWPVTSNASML